MNNIGFSRKCFTVDVWQFLGTTVEICLLDARLSTFPSNSSVSEVSLKFPNFLRS